MARAFRPGHVSPLRRIPGALLFLLVLIFAAACSSSPPPVLTGTITDAYTGEPINQASIVIGETTVTTDPAGMFSTIDWSAEDTVAISAPNYEPFNLSLQEQPEIAASEQLTITVDTVLRPNVISGVVRDDFTDEPIAGAELAVTLDVSNTLQAVTDAEGRYSLNGVPEQFDLQITAPDYAAEETTLNRAISHDVVLRPNILTGTIIDRYTNQPVADATVRVGAQQTVTDAEGRYRLTELPADATNVEISADGYAGLLQELERTTALDAVLRPDTLRGTLVNAETGAPVQNATIIATATYPGTDVAFARVDDSADGSFTLNGLPESGYLQVLAPGYLKTVLEIKPGELPSTISMEPFYVKALYITAAVASVPSLVEEYVDLIERTELNAIVIDLKSDLRDDLGLVYYDTQVPLAQELGLSADYIDMAGLVKSLNERGIYTIARIQLFSHDNVLSDARPEWSIRLKETGEVYADYPGPGIRYAYLDPTNKNVWDYNIQLGVEAALMGFDEINYDYVRFPDWYGDRQSFTDTLLFSEPLDPVNNPTRMFEVIAEFAETAHRAVNGAGAYTSLDVFGRTVLGASLTIAQDITLLGEHTDYVAPMPYPSLWWSGVFGVDVPVRYPYEVLKGSTASGAELMADTYGLQRPWLQDHTDPWAPVVVTYGPEELRAQIRAVEEVPSAGGWMLYDSANAYRGAFNGGIDPEE
ncbi:MAG: hypothetical protein HC822_03405 [Oscillochloris sp.]|nr:hypothetical protein [Oscillochloris sp.]